MRSVSVVGNVSVDSGSEAAVTRFVEPSTRQIPTTSRQVFAIKAWPASDGWTPSPAQ